MITQINLDNEIKLNLFLKLEDQIELIFKIR